MYEADYEMYCKGEAIKYLDQVIAQVSMDFTYEEMLDVLDKMKIRFQHYYEQDQDRKKMTKEEWEDRHRCVFCGDPIPAFGVAIAGPGGDYHMDCYDVMVRRVRNGKEPKCSEQ